MCNNVGILVAGYFVFLNSVIWYSACNLNCIFVFVLCIVVSAFFSYFVLYFVYLCEYVFFFVFLCFGVLIFEYFEFCIFVSLHLAYVHVPSIFTMKSCCPELERDGRWMLGGMYRGFSHNAVKVVACASVASSRLLDANVTI